MSYDIEICVKVEGTALFAMIDEPELSSPTYNLGTMFRKSMNWDYDQGVYYCCEEIIPKVERGIRELKTNRSAYEHYNPDNGWGDIDGAIKVLESLRECIYQNGERIPLKHLYMRW